MGGKKEEKKRKKTEVKEGKIKKNRHVTNRLAEKEGKQPRGK